MRTSLKHILWVENTFAFLCCTGNTSIESASEFSQGNTFFTHTRFQPRFLSPIGNTSALPCILASNHGNTVAFLHRFNSFIGNTAAFPNFFFFHRRCSFDSLYRKVHASFYWKDLPTVSMAVFSSATIRSLCCPAASAAAAVAFPAALSLPSAFCGGTAF